MRSSLSIAKASISALAANKLRALLTIIGIIAGVGAVIASLSIGDGVRANVTQQVQGLGSNLIFVRPGAVTSGGVRLQQGSAMTLTADDANAILDELTAVRDVAPELQFFGQFVANGTNLATRIVGVTPSYEEVRNFDVESGDFIDQTHLESRAYVVVIGANIAQTLFGERDPIDENVMLNRREFKVIGVLERKGSNALGNQDDVAVVPLTTLRYRLFSQRTSSGALNVSQINIQVSDETKIATTKAAVEDILRQRHRVGAQGDDFTVTSQEDTLKTRSQIADVLTLLLGSMAGISLLVGGVGIMNIMLVSVTERTREVGLRKAVGAKRSHILNQFLLEASIMSAIGGALGVAAGWGVSRIIPNLDIAGQKIPTSMDPITVLLSLGVAVITGLIFGVYPAYRAARLNPIDALRYE